MTPERWRQVKQVLGDVLDAPAAEREARLDQACASDAALRAEVASLLAADDGRSPSLPGIRDAIASEAAAVVDRADADGESALRSVLEGALGAQYEIVRPLGHGGMGAVYLARERALDRLVAIKVLRPDLVDEHQVRERFRREARIAARLTHPGILPLHAFGEVRGVWYFVMGYVRGETLAQRLRRQGRLPVPEVRRILHDLADALACAHRHGVVHRDIKPANVLLDETSGRALLTDFGIAKTRGGVDSLTGTGAVLGTPRYMSPEQARGAPDVDERSDVYSLGAVAYAMIAGREPFDGDDDAEVLRRRLSHDAPPLQGHVASVPDDLAAVVMRCLARDRALRWPDVRALRDALDRSDGQPSAALSEAMPDVSGYGPYALVWALAWAALAALTVGSLADRVSLVVVALLVPLTLALHVWNVEHQGLTPLQFARLAFAPPRWWGMWWPRPLRRPGDLWSRLPWPARLVRRTMTALLVALPATLLARRLLPAPGVALMGDLAWLPAPALQRGIVPCVVALIAGALAWSLARGLSLRESVHVLFGATMPSSAWRAPNVSRLLAPAWRDVRAPAHGDAADHARAIAEVVRLLPVPLAAAGAAAAGTARDLAAALASDERELERLSQLAGPAEVDRLGAQLAALEPTVHAEDDDRRELRALLGRQLEVVERLRARREVLLRRTERLAALLPALWMQLCSVQDVDAAAEGGEAGATSRLHALCAEASDQLALSRVEGGPRA